MGFSGISPGSLLLIFAIALLLLGGRRLRTLGGDLGLAVRSFREGLEGRDPSSEASDASKKVHDSNPRSSSSTPD